MSASSENFDEPRISRRVGIRKGVYLLPSLFTTASLFCGFFSIIQSISGDFVSGAWAIFFSGIFDALDGRVARLIKANTDFGIEYDSLADLASFGLAPALLVYMWGLKGFGRLGWAAAFLFFACGALRLARFNVQTNNADKRFFTGLPIPLAAYGLASFVIFHAEQGWAIKPASYFILPLTLVLSILMVSTVHYRNFKRLAFSKPQSFFYLVAAAIILFVVVSAPHQTMFFATMGYVLMGLTEELIHRIRRKRFIEHHAMKKESDHKPHLQVVFPSKKDPENLSGRP